MQKSIMSNRKQYITPAEFERLYGIDRRKLRTLRREGGGPPFRRLSSKVVFYSIRGIHKWFKSLPGAIQPPPILKPESAARRLATLKQNASQTATPDTSTL